MRSTYVKEVKLVNRTTYRFGEQQDIALQPRHLDRRIFKTSSGATHFERVIRNDIVELSGSNCEVPNCKTTVRFLVLRIHHDC